MPAERPPNTVATYGLTETFSGVVYEGWPLRGVEMRTVGDDVQLRCPMLLRCYRDGTDPRTDDGWFSTGDAGSVADDGRLSVFGRVDDMITSGAEKVWPVAVERILAQHPGVAEVAVVGRPDPEWGQAVTAVMIPANPAGASIARRTPRRRQVPASRLLRTPDSRAGRHAAQDPARQDPTMAYLSADVSSRWVRWRRVARSMRVAMHLSDLMWCHTLDRDGFYTCGFSRRGTRETERERTGFPRG